MEERVKVIWSILEDLILSLEIKTEIIALSRALHLKCRFKLDSIV